MDLIQSVIKSDTWQDNGGEGAIIDYPAGVYADAKMPRLQRRASAKYTMTHASHSKPLGNSKAQNHFFKSLGSRHLRSSAATGRPLSENLKHLAGIYRVQRVYLDSKHNDVLISGPAGPWRIDTSGRSVSMSILDCRHLLLDDLVVCLHNAYPKQWHLWVHDRSKTICLGQRSEIHQCDDRR